MMILFNLRVAQAIQEDRMRRSRRRRFRSVGEPIESFVRPPRTEEGDVIEVIFGTACDTSQIGA